MRMRTTIITLAILGQFATHRCCQAEDALTSIRNLGSQITFDETKPDRPVVGLRIYGCRGKDKHLVHLAAFDKLKKLHIGGDRVTDDGLKHLAELSELETLIIEGTSVKGSGLINILYLRKLHTLDLRDSRINDAGLKTLKLPPKLRTLDLSGTSVTDAGLPHLKKLKRSCPFCDKLAVFNPNQDQFCDSIGKVRRMN